MVDIVMPQLGETVSDGTVTQWLKKPGDAIKRDELLFDVGTDKVEMEIPAPADGILSAILVNEGETVDVGTRLAVIDDGTGAAAPRLQQLEHPKAQVGADQGASAVVSLLARADFTALWAAATMGVARCESVDEVLFRRARKCAIWPGPTRRSRGQRWTLFPG